MASWLKLPRTRREAQRRAAATGVQSRAAASCVGAGAPKLARPTGLYPNVASDCHVYIEGKNVQAFETT